MTDDTDGSLAERVDRLHGELRATEERPVEREASRWIGEAQAVAGDAADVAATEGSTAVVRERVGHVATLLDHVEETGDAAADEHVERAKTLADRIADAE
ncbi:hypothetical protein ACFQMA_19375 [Halosimplex aquaticum]|uniref:DUF8152 domain-containing protein n=1 Tax=Halosimplex aquaticum TaxID=3026162 RepID=A0ABD5YCE5_9EURY|nr:hypothetical protein [Halosimplex aquaticum]